MTTLIERYADRIAGVLSCFDRVVIQGTLPPICFAEGMSAHLRERGIRIFDYPRFALGLRDAIRANAERVAAENEVEIEFVRKASLRKERRVAEILAARGNDPGLVCILSAMETCSADRPWYDKRCGRAALKPVTGKCLHYYFYFVDPELGLCYLRVPTWCPFRLQFYFNGHHRLARHLEAQGIAYRMLDNAFVAIADLAAAQLLADQLDLARLHVLLDGYASRYCPAIENLGEQYHWSLMQVEFASDLVFRRQADLGPLYESLCRTAIHSVKPDNIATFLGRRLSASYQDEVGNHFGTRIEGTRIKHEMGPVSIKMYDKLGLVLRLETTANDVSFFKHHRTVEQRDGGRVWKLAPLRKSIYSLDDLRQLMAAANRRYLDFISALDAPLSGLKALNQVSRPVVREGRSYRGLNFFSREDQQVFQILARGEFALSGLRNLDLRSQLPGKTAGQISRILKRLRLHGLLKRVGHTYKYYLSRLGQHVVLTGLRLTHLFLIPQLAAQAA